MSNSNELETKLVEFEPLLKKLTNNPLKQFKGKKQTFLKLSYDEKEDLFCELRVRFIELFCEFEPERGKTFESYVGSKLSWYAHHWAEKKFDDIKYLVDVDDIEKMPYEEKYEEQVFFEDEISFELEDAIEQLPPRQRYVIEEHFLNNISIKELSERMNVLEKVVYRHRKLGLDKLRKIMKKDVL